MSKRKGKRPEPVVPTKKEDKTIFSMSGVKRTIQSMPKYQAGFRTGNFMTEKDRPRKKISLKDIDF